MNITFDSSPCLPNIDSRSSIGKWTLRLEENFFSRIDNQLLIPAINFGRIVVYSSFYLATFLEEPMIKESQAWLRAFFVEVIATAFFHPLTKIQIHRSENHLIEEFADTQAVIEDTVPAVPSTLDAEVMIPLPTKAENASATLCPELWQQIFKCLPPSDLIRCLRVNKEFRKLVQDIIRRRFTIPTETLPWEIADSKWGGDSETLINHIKQEPYPGTPDLWAKTVTFLAQAKYPFGKVMWEDIVERLTPTAASKVIRAERAFEALKFMQKLDFPMHDDEWGQLCDEIVGSIRQVQRKLNLDFKKDLFLFLASQNWTYARQKKKQHEYSLFNHFFEIQVDAIQAYQAEVPSIGHLFSFDQCLNFLRAFAQIATFDGARYKDVADITAYLIYVISTDPEKLNVATLLDIFALLEKIGGSWSIFLEENENGQRGFNALMEWAIINKEDFTKEQILEFLSFEWIGDDKDLNQRVLATFLNQLEIIDRQTHLSLEEAFLLTELCKPYASLPPTLPFFLNFFEREIEILTRSTFGCIAALLPTTKLALWVMLFDRIVTLCPQAPQKWPQLFGQEHFIRLMEWEDKLSFDQLVYSLSHIKQVIELIKISDLLVDIFLQKLEVSSQIKVEAMYELLHHSSKESIIKLSDSIKKQLLDPTRTFAADERGYCLRLLCLLYRHDCWDEKLDGIEKTQFAASVEALKQVEIHLPYQTVLLIRNPGIESLRLKSIYSLSHNFKTLQFLQKMQLLKFKGDAKFIETTHYFLGKMNKTLHEKSAYSFSLGEFINPLLVQNPLKSELEQTKQMLRLSKQDLKKNNFYALAYFLGCDS